MLINWAHGFTLALKCGLCSTKYLSNRIRTTVRSVFFAITGIGTVAGCRIMIEPTTQSKPDNCRRLTGSHKQVVDATSTQARRLSPRRPITPCYVTRRTCSALCDKYFHS